MNDFNPCICAYLPPPGIGFPEMFIHNLQSYKHHFPMVLFSDHDWNIGEIRIKSPDVVKTPKNRWAINNVLWFTALKIVKSNGYSHMIFIEADSRVGKDNWDKIMWNEYTGQTGALKPIAGSAVVFNAFGAGLAAAKKYEEFFTKNRRKLVPIPSYGATGSAEASEPRVFVNGSIAIYDMEFMGKLFEISSQHVLQAMSITAFDFVIGQRLWENYNLTAYDLVYNLACTYSSYGNILTTEAMRKQWLIDGQFVAVHQIDSNWEGPR